MTEQIYILNNDGTLKGVEDRNYVHNNGILHTGVQCWILNEKNEVLVQRRAETKDKSAGKWDVSFGGHCSKVEGVNDIWIANLLKEADEELSLSLNENDIVKLGALFYSSSENKNKELLNIYLTTVKSDYKFVFKDGEVSETKWLTLAELKNNLINNKAQYANRLMAFLLLESYIDQTTI